MSPKKKIIQDTKFDATKYVVFFEPILKIVDKDFHLSKDAIACLRAFLSEVIINLTLLSVIMVEHGKHKTLSARDVQSAVRAFFVDLLIRHAISQGTKAVTRFVTVTTTDKKKKTSKAAKSGLIISPSVVKQTLKIVAPDFKTDIRIADNATVYLAAVLEYLLIEVLELASNVAKANGRFEIKPDDIKKAIKNDDELNRTLCRLQLKY